MNTEETNNLLITELDYVRLTNLLSGIDNEKKECLEDEISRAHILTETQVPPDLVTMNSRIRYLNKNLGKEQVITLVYPAQEDLRLNKVSILSPLGSALLGLRLGQSIDWTLPNGSTRSFQVLEILYQPEANGDWNL